MGQPRYPLASITDHDFRQLCKNLWCWPDCQDCEAGKMCKASSCAFKRLPRLNRFRDCYRDLSASYEQNLGQDDSSALDTHQDVVKLVQRLKTRSAMTGSKLQEDLFGDHPNKDRILPRHREKALLFVVQVNYMINCSTSRPSLNLLEYGMNLKRWHSNVTFLQFVTDSFPMTDHPDLNSFDTPPSEHIKRELSAKILKKRLGIRFRPTDDLKSHLKFDRRNYTIDIFHHIAFLKEHLRMTKDRTDILSIEDALNSGAIPRQIALEVLDSIQKILFPLEDAKSHTMLQSLVSTLSFDQDCLRFESNAIRNETETEISYFYFGARLADIYQELEDPSPRGGLEKWLQRRSGARHAMLATLIGVFIAVMLGILALGVSIYQAYIGYQAWQHPMNP